MSEIEIPKEDDNFFDKDHIVFFTDDSGEIQLKYSLVSIENFQDLLLSVLSGAINKQVMDFIIEHLNQQELKEEALNIFLVKKLLGKDDHDTPIVKPSNFK